MMDFLGAKKLIESHDVITIFGHVSPDGDCYGCQIGLRELIRANYPNKTVLAIGSGVPAFFERISPMDQADDKTIASSLAILVDVSCLRRVEDPRVYSASAFLKFDHHLPSPLEPFQGLAIVDSNIIAAAEIIAEMAFEVGWKISRMAADALYLGICTDSGRFLYHGTTARTLEVANIMRKKGAKIRSIQKIAYYQSPEEKKMSRIIKKKAMMYGDVCYSVINLKTLQKCEISPQKAVRLVNVLANIYPTTKSYALFVYFTEKEINVELRSNKGYAVHEVAKMFQGGGHRYASGCTIYEGEHTPEEVVAAMNEVKEPDYAGV